MVGFSLFDMGFLMGNSDAGKMRVEGLPKDAGAGTVSGEGDLVTLGLIIKKVGAKERTLKFGYFVAKAFAV